MYTHIHECTHIHTRICTNIQTCTNTHALTYAHTHVYTHTKIYTYNSRFANYCGGGVSNCVIVWGTLSSYHSVVFTVLLSTHRGTAQFVVPSQCADHKTEGAHYEIPVSGGLHKVLLCSQHNEKEGASVHKTEWWSYVTTKGVWHVWYEIVTVTVGTKAVTQYVAGFVGVYLLALRAHRGDRVQTFCPQVGNGARQA